jgi:hypothetical protein
MASTDSTAIVARGIALYRSVLASGSAASCSESDRPLEQWLAYEKTVACLMTSGSLDSHAISAIFVIAANVRDSASTLLSLKSDMDNEIDHLTEEVTQVLVLDSE